MAEHAMHRLQDTRNGWEYVFCTCGWEFHGENHMGPNGWRNLTPDQRTKYLASEYRRHVRQER